MKTVVDPRRGDIEDDASSTKRRSLLSLVGSLLGEISLPRLAIAWVLLLAVPGLILGFAPIVASVWIGMASRKIMSPFAVICIPLLAVLVAVGWFVGGRLFRLAESSFWSLHSLAVQPGYAACREGLRHLAERVLSSRATAAQLARLRAAATVAAGLVVCGLAALVLMIAWPSSRWTAGISDWLLHIGWRLWSWPIASYWSPRISRLPRWSGQSPMRRWPSPVILMSSTCALVEAGRGASPICRISTSWASATAFGSKAADRARAAMSD